MQTSTTFTDTDIVAYILQVDTSGALGRSKRRLRLLSHLVRSEQDGNGNLLKAYTIGLDVFGKPVEFDPSLDSAVRVEMGRLR